ncbi:hypothetical protein Pla108_38680 [Botrimarina colliarenosi]|uniref:Uncharacterized protein n=1 Tax=Botrimarina colliarenosi TaxID=2528001 RepID=A0A5C6A0L8_9BACT|nr:hypothetical protein [Botrimarina colliarenosi]TWT93374.1 hypothetical protein Pla108_38680 [Botrimarina colliarenosi]
MSDATIWALTLLAQRSNWNRLGDRFSGQALRWDLSDAVGLVLLVAGFALGFWLLSRLGKLQENWSRKDRPRSPFSELIRAHGLSRRDRFHCRQVADELGLADPAEVFVRPDKAREALATRDADLARRLFG